MKEKKRWGKKFKDNRNWPEYNEELVVRGEFYLDFEWVKSWDEELKEMNKGKVGAKYEFPESLIQLQAAWCQLIDYRGVEGVTRKLVEAAKIPDFNDYSTINRRVNKTKIEFSMPQSGSCCVSTDGSGMKFENSGEYRARMYGKRRKYIKVVISADPINKKIIDCNVSLEGEGKSEPETAVKHMENMLLHGITINGFWGDGSFDVHDLFAFLEKNKIKPAVKIRKNAVLQESDCMRNREIIAIKKGYKKWARERQYGLRWNGTEGIFFAVKRKFGEQTRSTNIENAFNEVKRKFWVYDEMKEYAKTRANQPLA
jgi:hypothetical protein